MRFGMMIATLSILTQCGVRNPPVNSNLPTTQELVGSWYMGTATGMDCDLHFNTDKTLEVQFGGCFSFEPVIRASWQRDGAWIRIGNSELQQRLGSHLVIARSKSQIFLVPEINQSAVLKDGYLQPICFWKNEGNSPHRFRGEPHE